MSVVARASPIINIFGFKFNENKLYHLHSINMMPNLSEEEVLDVENVADFNYSQLPCEAKLSVDFEFLSVTTYDGTVKVIKMPAILDPISLDTGKA